jgi:hypothetical protein
VRCVHHAPLPHARAYPDEASARAGAESCCERVVYVKDAAGDVVWGVIPVLVELDQGEGRVPVRQPADEFVANWWSEVEEQARRERECTEV